MTKQNNTLLWVIVAVLVVLGIVYFRQEAAAPAENKETGPIVVGGLAPLTGDAATYGLPDQKAKMLAVEEINAAGGINGRELQIIWEDGKCNGTDAATATQKLLNVDQVKVILGGSCSGETLAAASLTQAARALLFSGLSSSSDITPAGDLVFRTYPSDSFQGTIMADFSVKKLNASRAAVISENTDYAQALRKVFIAKFIDLQKNIVFDESFNTGDTDFRTLLTKVKAATPEVFYIIAQSPTTGELILKQAKEAGITATILGADTFLNREAIAASAALYEGMYLVEVALDSSSARSATFINAYKTKYDVSPEYPGYLAASYDSVYLLAEAMKSVGTDPEKIAEYFNTQVSDWQGALGIFNFDENGDADIASNLRKVSGGQVTDLGPYQVQ